MSGRRRAASCTWMAGRMASPSPCGRPVETRSRSPAIHDKGNRDIFVATLERPLRCLQRGPCPCASPTIRPTTSSRRGQRMARRSSTTAVGELSPDHSGFSPHAGDLERPGRRWRSATRLTHNSSPDAQPDVSSDGTVVFWRQERIWTMDQDGSHQHRLSRRAGQHGLQPTLVSGWNDACAAAIRRLRKCRPSHLGRCVLPIPR